ncbi:MULTISPECIES: hypothetical protein [Haloarcula]|uniref:Uncharacterized protein n=1 Tax=Haloarcula pellucida TaxID=1427151 RepID=A0A830GSW9_9EURY|nr:MULTISPECIES: hypothetical protein [Halomicroarcula]MBX0350496.1 hypothetical protein [Halomicroarcula pellucida]MDS0280278.1 hypothetical protein [Halomicroarcula sp. S1AR25-4]GGO03595.1 hypothetical protein GCM10009030_39420 [Halomicroarcula pellucida]
MSTINPRPWYCPDALVDDYVAALQEGGDFRMLKAFKILRATVVNLGTVAITLYALSLGADPTLVGSLGLALLMLYNGIEIGDYAALLQALAEVSAQQSDDNDDP